MINSPGSLTTRRPGFQLAKGPRPRSRKPLDFWGGPAFLVFVTALLCLAHQGSVLQLAYPLICIGVAIYLIARYPVQFVGYSWWLWFLTPEVRRLADFFRGSFNTTSPIQVAPLAVAMLVFFPLARRYKFFGTKAGLPFLLMLIGTFYSYVVGIVNNGFLPATFAYAGWLFPVMTAAYIGSMPERYPELRTTLMRTFIGGGIVLGIYGLIQYAVMPPWDAFWMIQSGITSSGGTPVPFGSRLFGSLNSTGTYGLVITGCILLTTVPGYRFRMIAAALGVITLGATLVRSSWGATMLGILFLMTFVDARTKIRMIISILVMAAVVVPIVMTTQIGDLISGRFNTVDNIQSDTSFSARQDFYLSFLTTAFSNVAGTGMGDVGTGTRLDSSSRGTQNLTNNFDSGIMEIPFTLGWPGGLLFMVGIFSALGKGFKTALKMRRDKFVMAFFAVSIAMFIQMVFANTLTGVSGLLFMMGIVIPHIAMTYKLRFGAGVGGRT